MALVPNNVTPRETRDEVAARFGIAQDGTPPTQAQLNYQASIRATIGDLALDINDDVADSREKSLALTKLEEALQWATKAIFK